MTKRWWWRRALYALRGWWAELLGHLVLLRHQISQERYLMTHTLDDGESDEARAALRRVVDAREFPPDCVSAGASRGGPALFFKHDDALEVFIGSSYDHAATELLAWWRGQKAAPPTTATTTKLNRAQRRAWRSNKRRDLAKGE